MGHPDELDQRIFSSLKEVKKHGGVQWWLYVSTCTACAQSWMVAQDERIHDNFYLRRINAVVLRQIVDSNVWPEEFLRYEQVLRLGRQSGNVARFFDPQSPALVDTVRDLRRERPDISVEEIAYVLGVPISQANQLLKLAVKR